MGEHLKWSWWRDRTLVTRLKNLYFILRISQASYSWVPLFLDLDIMKLKEHKVLLFLRRKILNPSTQSWENGNSKRLSDLLSALNQQCCWKNLRSLLSPFLVLKFIKYDSMLMCLIMLIENTTEAPSILP